MADAWEVVGAAVVLVSMGVSLVALRVWGGRMGETACKWRVAYAPKGRAFSIWGLIYASTLASAAAQCTTLVPTLSLECSAMWAASWLFCAAWVVLFDAGGSAAAPLAAHATSAHATAALEAASAAESLQAAAAMLAAAAVAAVLAATMQAAWLSKCTEKWEKRLLALPLSVLAGWLCVAAALGIGIARKASSGEAAENCEIEKFDGEGDATFRERRRDTYRKWSEEAPAEASRVPLLLACVVAALAALVPDPLLGLPAAWAIANLKGFPEVGHGHVLSLLILALGSGGASMRAFL